MTHPSHKIKVNMGVSLCEYCGRQEKFLREDPCTNEQHYFIDDRCARCGVPPTQERASEPCPGTPPEQEKIVETKKAVVHIGDGNYATVLAVDDPVNHPLHYTHGTIEPIDVIEDWKLPYHLGNALKYIARHQYKGSPLEDLKKSRWYLDRVINKMEEEK